MNQSGVASGVRRIEAITGQVAYKYILRLDGMVEEATLVLKTSKEGVLERIRSILKDNKELFKKIETLNLMLIKRNADSILAPPYLIKGVKVIARKIEDIEIGSLRDIADILSARLKSGVIILVSQDKGKVSWVMKITQDLTNRLHAGDLIDKIAKMTNGGGGGRRDFGQAGGKEPKMVDEALKEGLRLIQEGLG